MTKSDLLTAVNDRLTRASNLTPPPTDHIAHLQEFKTLVQIATSSEVETLTQEWRKIIGQGSGGAGERRSGGAGEQGSGGAGERRSGGAEEQGSRGAGEQGCRGAGEQGSRSYE